MPSPGPVLNCSPKKRTSIESRETGALTPAILINVRNLVFGVFPFILLTSRPGGGGLLDE